MKKIMVYLIFIGLISSVTCLKMKQIRRFVSDLIPNPILTFLSQQKEDIAASVKYGVESAKKLVADVAIPISELPFYHYRAENKIYSLSQLKSHGEEFLGARYHPGTFQQKTAQSFGFFDMIDVKHVLCEFFYNAAEITFYQGRYNFNKDILKTVKKLGVLKPGDIETLEQLGMSKKDQKLTIWYWTEKYMDLVPLLGDPKGEIGDGYWLLSKEKVAIKKKYLELTNDIGTLVWHLLFTYQEENALRESIVHQHLKREQIRGHFMGNAFVLTMLNDTMKFHRLRNIYLGEDQLDTGVVKKEIKAFITKIGYIYTKGKVDPFEEKTFIKRAIEYILKKLGIISVPKDLLALYKFKMKVLVILQRILSRSTLSEKKAFRIIELCVNHWKIVFYLHVSGTLTSTKPAPQFYNHHETVEESDSYADTSDSDTVERDKSSSFGSFQSTDSDKPGSPLRNDSDEDDDDDLSEFGPRALEEKDEIAKSLEDQNPFQELLHKCLIKLKWDFRVIREQLIKSLGIICDYLLLKKKNCSFIELSIKNINTYLLKKDGRIASRKWCHKNSKKCSSIEPTDYMLFIRKITEIQGVSMSIIEYLILRSEELQSIDHLQKRQRIKLEMDIKSTFAKYKFLRIFITKEYRKALTNYAMGHKDSNIAKLAEARVKQIEKGIESVPKKPARLDPRDMDDILIPENSKKDAKKEIAEYYS